MKFEDELGQEPGNQGGTGRAEVGKQHWSCVRGTRPCTLPHPPPEKPKLSFFSRNAAMGAWHQLRHSSVRSPSGAHMYGASSSTVRAYGVRPHHHQPCCTSPRCVASSTTRLLSPSQPRSSCCAPLLLNPRCCWWPAGMAPTTGRSQVAEAQVLGPHDASWVSTEAAAQPGRANAPSWSANWAASPRTGRALASMTLYVKRRKRRRFRIAELCENWASVRAEHAGLLDGCRLRGSYRAQTHRESRTFLDPTTLRPVCFSTPTPMLRQAVTRRPAARRAAGHAPALRAFASKEGGLAWVWAWGCGQGGARLGLGLAGMQPRADTQHDVPPAAVWPTAPPLHR